MPKKNICNMDCFHCIYDDCINDTADVISSENREHRKNYARIKREVAREKGFCITWCIRPATTGKKCAVCYESARRYREKKKMEKIGLTS